MLVADLISSRKEIYSVRENDTVHEAARYLRDRQVRAAGVINEEGKLVGVISQADISDKVAAENKCPAWLRVSEVMTAELVHVTPDAPLELCLRLMEENNFYHLLIVGTDSRYHGMISTQDIMAVIASDEKARADLLEEIIFPKR
jgi:predicted transcriptional regulator